MSCYPWTFDVAVDNGYEALLGGHLADPDGSVLRGVLLPSLPHVRDAFGMLIMPLAPGEYPCN